jgi:uncharacterized Zn finger protein
MGWGWDWKPYVSVAERREKAKRHIGKRVKQGLAVQPVEIEGRKIARTFWGDSWCKHLESFSDYENRLPRGRTYIRNGSVCHLEIASGEIKSIVSGSELYDVKIAIRKLPGQKWSAVKAQCSGQIGSLLELLQGKLSNSVMSVVTDRKEGLFPLPAEIKMECSCPDWAVMCKHVAATLYGVGARLDNKPELLFLLRGVDHEELIEADAATFATKSRKGGVRRIADGDLQDVFGIELLKEETSASKRGKAPMENVAPQQQPSRRGKGKNEPVGKDDRLSRATASKAKVQTFTGKTIRELRARFDMSQGELATLIGVSTASVNKWEKERGRINLQSRTMSALSDAIKLSKKQAWRQIGER